jgi:hypothetical protein
MLGDNGRQNSSPPTAILLCPHHVDIVEKLDFCVDHSSEDRWQLCEFFNIG